MNLDSVFDKNNREILLIAGLVIVILLWLDGCRKNKAKERDAETERKISMQNINSMRDSIRTIKTKNGELEQVKGSFVTRIKDLEKMNEDLYNESKKEIGELKAIIKGRTNTVIRSVQIDQKLKQYADSVYGLTFENTKIDSGLTWSIKGESRFGVINGKINPGVTLIYENKIKSDIVLGFREEKDQYLVFARSTSPLLTFDELTGALIIPKKTDPVLNPSEKKKMFVIGPQVGFGIGAGLKPSPFVGVGITYSLIRF